MVQEYFRTGYDSEAVNESVPAVRPAEMKESITIRESGWSFDQSELNSLSKQTDPIAWKLNHSFDNPNRSSLYKTVEENLSKDQPVIVVVDVGKLRNKGSATGLHAVVAIGLNDQQIAISDPWGEMAEPFDRDEFAHAWDPIAHRTITTHMPADLSIDTTTSGVSET